MEFEFPSTLILLSLLTLLFTLVKLLRNNSTASTSLLNLIPGPKKLPLIGNLHLVVGDSPLHHVLRDLAKKYGPLMHLQLGEVSFLIVSSVDVAKQVLRTHDVTFANRPPGLAARIISYNYTTISFAPYGDYWRRLRKICTLELLSPKRVQFFRPVREEENLNMARWIASRAGSEVNLSMGIYLSSFDIIARASIGKKTEERETVTAAIKKVLKLVSRFTIVDLYPSSKLLPLISGIQLKIERVFRQTDRVLDAIINQHRAAAMSSHGEDADGRSEDLADVLLKFQQDGSELSLSDDNIKAVISDMFVAGSDTSATAAEWAMSEMIRNPITLKNAQEEVRKVFDVKGYVDEAEFHQLIYLKLVIKETLRLHPPGPLLVPRENDESCEINGYKIPAKTRLFINAWAMGRDPEHWKDADKFIPERFLDSSIDFKGNNLEYIPFGSGRRTCPGMLFGLANIEFTLAMLLHHFDWEMPNGMENEELDMTEVFGNIVKRKHELHLIPIVKRPLDLHK